MNTHIDDDTYYMAVWGEDNTDLDNGFAPNEEINWVLHIDDYCFVASEVVMDDTGFYSPTFQAKILFQKFLNDRLGHILFHKSSCQKDASEPWLNHKTCRSDN